MEATVTAAEKKEEMQCAMCWEMVPGTQAAQEEHFNAMHNPENYLKKEVPNYISKCPHCPLFESSNAQFLLMHMYFQHTTLSCKICGMKFDGPVDKIKDAIAEHLSAEHKPTYKCTLCIAQFYTKDGLTKHVESEIHVEVE